jgi:8-oxo-dGTP pyrophosphatase MutT (NUDIX family)
MHPAKQARAPLPDPRRQVAALVFRISDERGLEILLVDSLRTGRAVMPKGWLVAGEDGCEAAAREAYEEAGVRGRIDRKPIGTYEYWKQRTTQDELLHVDVYPLEVERQCKKWPEQGRRKLRWLPPTEAAKSVDEPALATLIRWFAPATTGERSSGSLP